MISITQSIPRLLYVAAAFCISLAIYYALKDKINNLLATLQAQRELESSDHIASYIPHSVFHKCWRTEGGIIAELHLEASAKTGKESISNITQLLDLSLRHDKICLNNLSKQKKEVNRSVG